MEDLFEFRLSFGADLVVGVVVANSEEKAETRVRARWASYLRTHETAVIKVKKLDNGLYVHNLYKEIS